MAARASATPADPSFWVTRGRRQQSSDSGEATEACTRGTASIFRRLGRSLRLRDSSGLSGGDEGMIGEPRSCLSAAAPTQWSAQGSRGTRRFSSSTQFWMTTNWRFQDLLVSEGNDERHQPSRQVLVKLDAHRMCAAPAGNPPAPRRETRGQRGRLPR